MNNEHVVMFKRGAFELGTCIVPVAIRYHPFVNAFWNSRTETFLQHLFQLWSSWALVCDVHYLVCEGGGGEMSSGATNSTRRAWGPCRSRNTGSRASRPLPLRRASRR